MRWLTAASLMRRACPRAGVSLAIRAGGARFELQRQPAGRS